ncbi:hypothetical protein ABTY61_24895 [Kitasatospora sp. NPDC096128]
MAVTAVLVAVLVAVLLGRARPLVQAAPGAPQPAEPAGARSA